MSILFIDPLFQHRVWGGHQLREWFGDAVPEGPIGEAWAISGLPGESGTISDLGMTLDEAWKSGMVTGEPRTDDFPILVKFLDPDDWLSVQVHPDDEQAHRMEGQPRGKAECWYVIDADAEAELILGHTAEDAADLRRAAEEGRLAELLIRRGVAPGSFFMVPAGAVHAVGPGMLLYEVQESSDITYRLHDFDRLGMNGKPRDLHIDKGYAVVAAPFDHSASETAGPAVDVPGGQVRTLIEADYFTVTEYRVDGEMIIPPGAGYRMGSVVAGEGTLRSGGEDFPVARGASFIEPAGEPPLIVSGDLVLILTEPGAAE